MKREQKIAELERLARLLGVEVRYERMGTIPGGLCRVGGRMFLFVNKALSTQSKIELMAAELGTLDWEKHFVKPEVRKLLE
ncbi:hypothetical protein DRQ27_01400 [bacterium]|nr:hypothetical protein [bacterium]RKZ32934.1 MAG: hypothetical protein DRQ27_01400 [bacterium]